MRTCLFIAVGLLFAQCPVFGQCKESLAYLSSKIPAVQDQRLTKVRDSILSTKIADVIRQIREQGMSLREAAEKMFAQAGQFDDSMSVSANVIRQIATDADSLLRKLKAREYSGLPLGDSMLGAHIGNYIVSDWAKEANQETAVQVACNADHQK